MSSLCSICYVALLLTPAGSQIRKTGNSFPDTSTNHWAYQADADLKSVGLSGEFPDSLGPRPPQKTRYVFAVSTHASYVDLAELARQLQTRNDEIAHFESRESNDSKQITDRVEALEKDLKSLKKALPMIQDDFSRLTKEFNAELIALGVDVAEMKGHIQRDCHLLASLQIAKPGEANTQFADVLESHWAANAVRSLRSVGILHGYEGGLFRG